MKQLTQKYVAKKSKVLTPTQMHTVLHHVMTCGDHKWLLAGVGTALLYYGLLRVVDLTKITIADVKKNNEGKYQIKFEHERKRRNLGFTYVIPAIYTKMFDHYVDEIDNKSKTSDRFMKNWNRRSKSRIQNCGKNAPKKFLDMSCELLGISNVGYTSHCY